MLRRLVILSTIALMFAGTTAMAQRLRQRTDGRRTFAGRRIERLQQRLNLSETQMNEIRSLQETRKREIQTLRTETRDKLKERSERRREINQRFISGVRRVLTPEQLQNLPRRQNFGRS